MSLYKQFKTDNKTENEGFLFELVIGENETCKFRLSRMGSGNKAYTKALEKAYKPYRKLEESGNMPGELSRKLLTEVFVDTILLDWEGVTDSEDKPIPFSKEAAKKVLKDLPDLYDILLEESRRADNFKNAVREESAKN